MRTMAVQPSSISGRAYRRSVRQTTWKRFFGHDVALQRDRPRTRIQESESMNQNRNVKELRDKAAKYRAIARLTTDEATARRILELTEELEQQARDMERGK